MSDIAGTFDPAEDEPSSHIKGIIKQRYELLRGRGEIALAEELRRKPLIAQKTMVERIPEFDPKHDGAANSARFSVRRVYNALIEERAEELRHLDSIGAQKQRAAELLEEAVDGYIRRLVSGGS